MLLVGRQLSQEASTESSTSKIVALVRQGSDENTYTYGYGNKMITSAYPYQLLATVYPEAVLIKCLPGLNKELTIRF